MARSHFFSRNLSLFLFLSFSLSLIHNFSFSLSFIFGHYTFLPPVSKSAGRSVPFLHSRASPFSVSSLLPPFPCILHFPLFVRLLLLVRCGSALLTEVKRSGDSFSPVHTVPMDSFVRSCHALAHANSCAEYRQREPRVSGSRTKVPSPFSLDDLASGWRVVIRPRLSGEPWRVDGEMI